MSLLESENPPSKPRGAKCPTGEEPKTTAPIQSFLEMRRHPRLHAAVAMSYQMSLLESEKTWDGEGTLRNISFGGVYFTSNGSLPLKPGQISNFSISTGAPCDRLFQTSRLSARGMVMRVQRPAPDNAPLGIALKFLTPLQLVLA